jgi:UDPglucose 6-dehydrogenase
VVTGALGLDSRIGSRYLKGALGYGGPCFPRDNRAFARLARNLGALPVLAEATDEINRHQSERLSALVDRYLRPGAAIAVLGLSYKPDTSVIEESASIELARRLAADGYAVTVHDPQAIEQARAVLRDAVSYAEDAAAAVAEADMVVLATAWPEYAKLDAALLARPNGQRVAVVDCWRALPCEPFKDVCDLVYLGNGDNPEAPADSASAVG